MMEENGENGDDQGSGWLQVKKKHRSCSKFSLHGWVGGLSGKPVPKALQGQPSLNKRRSSINSGSQDLKVREGSVVHDVSTVVDHSSNTDKYSTLDKSIVSNKCPTSVVETVEGLGSDGRTRDDQKVSGKDNLVVIQKIKWGDLDDEVLIMDSGNISGAHIKFGGFENDNLVSRNAEIGAVSGTHMTASSKPGKSTLITAKCEVDHMQQPLSSPQAKSFVVELKEGNEVASDEVDIQITNDHIPSSGNDVFGFGRANYVHTNSDPLNSCCPCNESSTPKVEAVLFMEPLASDVICETGDAVIPEGANIDESLSTVIDVVASASVLPEKIGGGSPRQSTTPESNEDCMDLETQYVVDGFSEVHTRDTGEDEAVESKERFRQRLWCFLFENLNRSIDELYLLCELECDIEQMKEAILVLEEAAFDFKELKSRVVEFETVKKASPKLNDGAPMTLKSDQRRPHALSWEVRRMTTSPHRAEILSSSLEAFSKIQQERANMHASNYARRKGFDDLDSDRKTINMLEKHTCGTDTISDCKASAVKPRKQSGVIVVTQGSSSRERRNADLSRSYKMKSLQNGRTSIQNQSASESNEAKPTLKDCSAVTVIGKGKRELIGPTSEVEKIIPRKDRLSTDTIAERHSKYMDNLKRQIPLAERDKEHKIGSSINLWKSMDAWKEKRNWEDILATPTRFSSRFSYSPGMARKSAERARNLRDKLMSSEKKKRTAVDLKKEAEEKHARAMRIRGELETERVQKLQRTSEKLNRVNEWQAVRSMKLREGMFARHQRGESRHEAFLAKVVRRAGDESSKVNEVRFITSLNDENKKIILREKLQDSELRRAEKLQVMKIKQKEDIAREEAVLERKKLIEAEKSQRLAETQRKKEEALVRREEERKASSAAREAKAMEQMRRKEVRAKARQEEAELLAQKLAERLRESEQRRKFYLEQIRERASMDFRDQLSPFRRSLHKEGQSRSTPTNNGEVDTANNTSSHIDAVLLTGNTALQNSLKKRIKKVRQKLMALKHEFLEPLVGSENSGSGYRAAVGTARAKIGRWLQELQRLRQARKEGASSIGLITAEMIKFLEGKEPELQASRQAGLLDFIASALPASHTSKPEACQVTVYLLRLLRVVLSLPANRSYFLAQNLLPPITPLLAGALENYIKIAASSNIPSSTNLPLNGTLIENLESITEVLDGLLWTVTVIIGHVSNDEHQLQMQNGLLELVIAYQVIHRLRDLFALYDRPQVEGSPFPSSILLSINLLVTLTSRFRTVSSIDWDYSPSDTIPRIKIEEEKLAEVALLGSSSFYNRNSDHELPLSVVNDAPAVSLPEVPEDKPLDESCTSSIMEKAIDKKTDKVQSSTTKMDTPEAPKAFQNLKDDKVKSSVSRKDEKSSVYSGAVEIKEERFGLKQPVAFLLSAISETGLVCLPSLLTAVLLQANNRLSSDQQVEEEMKLKRRSLGEELAKKEWEQDCFIRKFRRITDKEEKTGRSGVPTKLEYKKYGLMNYALHEECARKCEILGKSKISDKGSYVLPSNFEDAATGVLKVLNNLALIDINFIQMMLARADLKMEFFHLMSFLLSHCTSKWGVANDKIGLLMFESVLLLSYFSLFHYENQAVLRWGKSPTILHKLCDLPFVFFSDPELMPILAGTLVAACFGCDQNKDVIQQELSTDMLLSLLRSCKNGLSAFCPRSAIESRPMDEVTESIQLGPELRKLQGDISQRLNRFNLRSNRPPGKGGGPGNSARTLKMRNTRDFKPSKSYEEKSSKHNLSTLETPCNLMLHSRFPESFIDKAEQFFSIDVTTSVSKQT